MEKTVAIQLKNITKTFGEVVANNKVDLSIYKGEILSILGENGSGKTTLMNMIAGIYFPDDGVIEVNGNEVIMRSPKDAYDQKIGMIHQHFKLVDVFTAIDNILLGEEMPRYSIKENAKSLKEDYLGKLGNLQNNDKEYKKEKSKIMLQYVAKVSALPFIKLGKSIKFNHLAKNRGANIREISSKYGFDINLNKKIYDMAVSEKQTVEIIKVLYRGADILILDEPTAVLTPQEIEKLFAILRKMREDGKSIIIITHKLNEVMALSDRVAVLRKGEHVGTVNTKDTNEKELTEMMVGKKIELNIERTEPVDVTDRLVVKNISATDREGIKILSDISFSARSGEILGIAGIAGSGQRELLEAIAGLQKLNGGEIIYYDPTKNDEKVDLKSKSPVQIRELGVRLSFVPEDRLGMGLVGNMDIVDNMMLRSYRRGKTIFVDRKNPKKLADSIVQSLEVATPGTNIPVRRLSGGNVQKVLVGREISSVPTVLMAAYPVRGLDINSSYTIYNLLNQQKQKGVAVIFVGEDLDVLIELCDRILVICAGKITGIVEGRKTNKEEIGLLMTKTDNVQDEEGVTNDGKK